MRIFALLATIALADKSDFPRDDAKHADCHVTALFDQINCASLYDKFYYEILVWGDPEVTPAQGTYSMWEESLNDYIWSSRLTKNKQYTDDQLFEFTATAEGGDGCSVAGHSRSRSPSVYDYSVNFCNLWNVYNSIK